MAALFICTDGVPRCVVTGADKLIRALFDAACELQETLTPEELDEMEREVSRSREESE